MRKGFSIEVYNGKIIHECRFEENLFDNELIDNEDYFLAIEGVILNKQKLLYQFAASDFKKLILDLFVKKRHSFFDLLEGEFSGFVVDKVSKTVFVFTNATSTQKVFYYQKNNTILIDTSVKNITEKLKRNNIQFSIDQDSIYQMLAFTNLLENKTPIQDIFKINDACYLEINTELNLLKEKKYFEVEWERYSGTKTQALQTIHEIFAESVSLEYQKDDELGKAHFSLLSGGLDSRMALLYGIKQHENPQKVFCFSQSGYLDETISRKIAQQYQLDYQFVKLDGGKFLKNIDRLVSISEGMVLYTGAVHVDYAMRKIKTEGIGLIHSGQIGDGVLGGFNTVPNPQKPGEKKVVVNAEFLPRISDSFHQIRSNYQREELFYLKNIAFNRTVLGAQVFQQLAYQTSPFMNKDFMGFAISLPEAWKYNHQFYLDWINTYCKDATYFRWERTLMKPNAQWKTRVGDKVMKRMANILFNKIMGLENKVSMYPYQYYFSHNADIHKYYNHYYFENLHFLDGYTDLRNEIDVLFNKKDFFSKSNAINIIGIFKYYFS